MSKPVILPTVTITQGVQYFQRYRLSNSSGPFDLTDWTGTLMLAKRPFDPPFFRKDVTLGGTAGTVDVLITAEEADEFDTLPIIGGTPVGIRQIYLIAPDPTQNQVWQGPISVEGRLK